MSATRHLVLGTAGHIDHGKSSLIKALTGVDPDRLAEEKQRGITIELGFAELMLPSGRSMGVVDVPGHERFVRQMIAGASGIDIALLCIAADDGIMPQTREHVAVLEVLGIDHCLVALTKADLVDDEWLAFMQGEIAHFLEESPFATAHIVPVSSVSGLGLEELKLALDTLATSLEVVRKTSTNVRYPVDRVFTIKGSGTVLTGTLWSGEIAAGDTLEILPKGLRARVRSVQTHGKTVEKAEAGNRVAVNLNAVTTSEVRPGDFLASVDTLTSTDRFDAWVRFIDTSGKKKALASGARLRIAHGTREVIGRLLLMNEKAGLAPGESAYAQIRLDTPLPVSWGDHFVLRSYSPMRVAGGGMVLHAHPKRRTHTDAAETALLDALRKRDVAEVGRRAFALQRAPLNAQELAAFSGLSAAEAFKMLTSLQAEGTALALPSDRPGTSADAYSGPAETSSLYFATKGMVQQAASVIERLLIDFHSKNPTQTSLSRQELQQAIGKRAFGKASASAFYALLRAIAAAHPEKLHLGPEGASHPRAGSGAAQVEKDAALALHALLAKAGQNPPSTADLIAASGVETKVALGALKLLEDEGKAGRVTKDLWFDATALAALEQALRDHLLQKGAGAEATVAELKDAMRTSRKYAVPLLEYFDNQHVTRRSGDLRRLISG